MSRSGYVDDYDQWDLIRWRGAVASALNGKRGQAFLREMLAALNALPAPRLESDVLVSKTGCCAMGAVAIARGQDVSAFEIYDSRGIADAFGIADAMCCEIAFINDDWYHETEEERFARVREWVEGEIRP